MTRLLPVVLLLLVACSGGDDKPEPPPKKVDPPETVESDQPGPEDCVAKLEAAVAKKDLAAFTDLVAPDDRAKMAFVMCFIGNLGIQQALGGDDKEVAQQLDTELKAVMEKHGLGDVLRQAPLYMTDRQKLAARFVGVDVPAFMGELLPILERIPGKAAAEAPMKGYSGKLTDLKRDGDRATGKINGQEILFVRIDGEWYLKLEKRPLPPPK